MLKILILSLFFAPAVFAQNVHIPDSIFKAELLRDRRINRNDDNEIQIEEAANFTENISTRSENITNLTGIEAFSKMTLLNCSLTNIRSLDLSQNISLKWLHCSDTDIRSLDVSKNINLESLYCDNTALKSLDVSKNINLEKLDCHYTGIESLDLRNNTKLKELNCSYTDIRTLDLSQNLKLKSLNLEDTPRLTYIKFSRKNHPSIKRKARRINRKHK